MRVFRRKSWVMVATAAAAVLSACGGGSETTYGAIALNATDPAAIIVTNFIDQAKANDAAVTRCGEGCEVIYEFAGSGNCGALATGSGATLVWGVGGGRSAAEAEAAAVEQCSANGGANCAIPGSIPGRCLP